MQSAESQADEATKVGGSGKWWDVLLPSKLILLVSLVLLLFYHIYIYLYLSTAAIYFLLCYILVVDIFGIHF